MPGKTKTFTVTDATPVAVVAQTDTHAITVAEDPSVSGWPTQNFIVRKPASTDTAIQVAIGGRYTFTPSNPVGFYARGDIVGYVQLANSSTSTTMQQDEN